MPSRFGFRPVFGVCPVTLVIDLLIVRDYEDDRLSRYQSLEVHYAH